MGLERIGLATGMSERGRQGRKKVRYWENWQFWDKFCVGSRERSTKTTGTETVHSIIYSVTKLYTLRDVDTRL